MKIRRNILAIAVGAATLAGSLFVASPARAASCSGNGCNGLDPIATGCATSVSTTQSGGAFGGTLEIRRGNCTTKWARFTPANNHTYQIWVTRVSDGVWAGNGLYNTYVFSGTGAHYGDQVYGSGTASACVDDLTVGGRVCIYD